jgi:riboflavin biosynthesis pyrimidine reductase
VLQPLEVLYEADLPGYGMPADLEALYGRLGFRDTVLYSNFVSSLDGVVTLGSTPSAGSAISGKYAADRFVMGLLRACADAVVIGAGTLRATPGHIWTAGHVYPELAASFAELRRRLGRSTDPSLVIVTASGEVDASHPAISKGAIVMTTRDGARTIGSRLPPTCEVVELGAGKTVDMELAVAELRTRGYQVMLTEGGPHLVGQLIERGLLDELFLTVSPVLAGRGKEQRLGMVEGVELLPSAGVWTELVSARRHGDYLFTRHRKLARGGSA